jgi:hypothetical protein
LGHDLLELLLLLVPKAVLLLVIALVARVILVGVLVLVGGVGDEVGGVAALEAVPW